MYFNNIASWEVAEKLWYTINAIDNYYNSPATTRYTEHWIEYKRCTVCKVYRNITDYIKRKWNRPRPACKICSRQMNKNAYKYRQNIGLYDYWTKTREKIRFKKDGEIDKRIDFLKKMKKKLSASKLLIELINEAYEEIKKKI